MLQRVPEMGLQQPAGVLLVVAGQLGGQLLRLLDDLLLDGVEQLVLASVIGIKGGSADIGPLAQLFDGDLVDILLLQKLGPGSPSAGPVSSAHGGCFSYALPSFLFFAQVFF